MIFGLVINRDKKDALVCSKEIIALLKDDAEILASSSFDNELKDVEFLDTDKDIVNNCDVVITVGGDGTIINAGKFAAKANKPLIGVNLGRIGFVANIEKDEIGELKRILKGDYKLDKRALIDCVVKSSDFGEKSYVILNEVSLHRDTFSSMVDFDVEVNNEKIISYRADGLLVSTATGSTAYSFSAGGPLVDPQVDCMVLNPVCPHALSSRPIVFSADSVLKARLQEKNKGNCYLTVDGKNAMLLQKDDEVIIKKSESTLDLIILKDKNFYKLFNEKLKEEN